MELKFVSDEMVTELTSRGNRTKAIVWTEFIEELYKHPNRWAEFGHKVNSSASAYTATARFKNIEVRLSGGNNLAKSHPDKKQWTVFVRFVPENPGKTGKTKSSLNK